jgi:phosphoribosylglycinamide formyltransferase-1
LSSAIGNPVKPERVTASLKWLPITKSLLSAFPMRNLEPVRVNMINLHPAAPSGPAGTWQEVIWQLIERGAEASGVMMHLVTPELDKGPPVAYGTYSIRGEPFDRYWKEIDGKPIDEIKKEGENNRLFKSIRQHGLAREFPLIIATIKAFSQGKIRISPEKQVIDAEGRPIKGYNMTDEINEPVKGVGVD